MDVHSIHGFSCFYGIEHAQAAVLNGTSVCIVPVLVPDVLDSYCTEAGPLVQSYFHVLRDYQANGIEGPDCPPGLSTFALMAGKGDVKLPLVHFEQSFIDTDTSNGANLATAASVFPSFRKLAKMLWAFLVANGWTHNIGILFTNTVPDIQTQAGNLRIFYERRSDGRMQMNSVDFDDGSADALQAALMQMKLMSRGTNQL